MGWTKPTRGWMKVNCDGAFNKNENVEKENFAGIRFVIRNEECQVIVGLNKMMYVNSSLEAETIGLKEGMILAKLWCFNKIVLETGFEILYKEITGKRRKWGLKRISLCKRYTREKFKICRT